MFSTPFTISITCPASCTRVVVHTYPLWCYVQYRQWKAAYGMSMAVKRREGRASGASPQAVSASASASSSRRNSDNSGSSDKGSESSDEKHHNMHEHDAGEIWCADQVEVDSMVARLVAELGARVVPIENRLAMSRFDD